MRTDYQQRCLDLARENAKLETLIAANPFCMATKDGFTCNLRRGHDGDHKDLHPSGGCVGWSAGPGEPEDGDTIDDHLRRAYERDRTGHTAQPTPSRCPKFPEWCRETAPGHTNHIGPAQPTPSEGNPE